MVFVEKRQICAICVFYMLQPIDACHFQFSLQFQMNENQADANDVP